ERIAYVMMVQQLVFFLQAEDGIRNRNVTGVQTCALPIWPSGKLNKKGPVSLPLTTGPFLFSLPEGLASWRARPPRRQCRCGGSRAAERRAVDVWCVSVAARALSDAGGAAARCSLAWCTEL